MRLLTSLLILVSSSAYSAELFCNLGEYSIKLETNLQSCSRSGNLDSVLTVEEGAKTVKEVAVACMLNASTQFVTRRRPKSMAPVLSKIGYVQVDIVGDKTKLHINNDQGIGFKRGVSTLSVNINGDEKELDFSLMNDCPNLEAFFKEFFDLPDTPEAPQD